MVAQFGPSSPEFPLSSLSAERAEIFSAQFSAQSAPPAESAPRSSRPAASRRCVTPPVSIPTLWLTAAKFPGKFVEAHTLDARRARKVPAKMRGRSLSGREVTELLDRLG